jgi:hypothetical protein
VDALPALFRLAQQWVLLQKYIYFSILIYLLPSFTGNTVKNSISFIG